MVILKPLEAEALVCLKNYTTTSFPKKRNKLMFLHTLTLSHETVKYHTLRDLEAEVCEFHFCSLM
jgi:hypothetical protein